MRTSLFATLALLALTVGCDFEATKSSDKIQEQAQERMLKEATAQTGMPSIKNFRERKMLKSILELRDQDDVITYTYIHSEQTGKLRFLGVSIGYGIPYATQYTNPQKVEGGVHTPSTGNVAVPQADPNGLYSPSSAEGTWVLLKDPNSDNVQPIYIEPRIVVSRFKLPDSILAKD